MTQTSAPGPAAVGRATPVGQAAPAVLERARRLVVPVMRSAVDTLAPPIRSVARYHLGWAEVDGSPADGDGGKCLRPALALLSAEAVGADGGVSLPGGAAVELVHNFSLVHDDVIDGDGERRHRATVWAAFGTGTAILVGDALLALAQQLLMDGGGPRGFAAARSLAGATAEMIAGQADDMAFETEAEVSLDRCEQMEGAKTGAILACAASIGAVLAGASEPAAAALHDYGRHLGLAFQAVDDLLGIWGEPGRTGKPAASDLRQHKKTLPVVAALAGSHPRRRELARLLARPELDEAGAARAAELVEACGGREWAAASARDQLDLAIQALDGAGLERGTVEELTGLAHFVTDRER